MNEALKRAGWRNVSDLSTHRPYEWQYGIVTADGLLRLMQQAEAYTLNNEGKRVLARPIDRVGNFNPRGWGEDLTPTEPGWHRLRHGSKWYVGRVVAVQDGLHVLIPTLTGMLMYRVDDPANEWGGPCLGMPDASPRGQAAERVAADPDDPGIHAVDVEYFGNDSDAGDGCKFTCSRCGQQVTIASHGWWDPICKCGRWSMSSEITIAESEGPGR